ncbi:DUF475 domain-containing protein [Candidatus Sumerlaeota bacterium]|nr:DUF475 domain-containing protein [Candidatus Sumerlaeota bacterium]
MTILGLCVFEVVSSLDNAVVNADVLATMSEKWRRRFIVWGILFAVFIVRGMLPWAIIWAMNPALGPWGAFMASFRANDPIVRESIERSKPLLLIGGGLFLVLLFFHWLFLEDKRFGLPGERFFSQQGAWFFAVASLVLSGTIWFALKKDPMMAFSAALGSSAFFITYGFKEYAEKAETRLTGTRSEISDLSKFLYLQVLDATFSIDGVLGAFAFTMSVPLILLGNGLGAMVVRDLTVRGVSRIKNYAYLKNGAMYSILCLGGFMIAESFGHEIPDWIAPVVTLTVVGYFFHKSIRQRGAATPQDPPAAQGSHE